MDPVVDLEVIKAIKDIGAYRGSDDLLRELFAMFVEQSDLAVRSLATAIDERDLVNIKAHAHKLKGSAGNLGATRLAKKCLALELLAKDGGGEPERLKEAYGELKTAVADSVAQLSRQLD